MRLFVRESPELPGVTTFSATADFPRPHIGVLGGIHGNEVCGVAAVARLRADALAGQLALCAGSLVVIEGNPEAARAGRRYTRGGADLNRLFDFAFLEDLPEERWSPEHRRAAALGPVFEDLDVLLDLHSAGAPTPPFVIVNDVPGASDLATRVGFDFVTRGWQGPDRIMEKVTIGVMQRLGRPGISVECGQHESPETIDAAWSCTECFLRATGLVAGEAPRGEPTFLEVVQVVARPSSTFSFTREIRGLDRLEPGIPFATDGLAELHVREPCFALMPNDRVPVGRDMIFLAREDESPRLS